jgi:hypothetical protein
MQLCGLVGLALLRSNDGSCTTIDPAPSARLVLRLRQRYVRAKVGRVIADDRAGTGSGARHTTDGITPRIWRCFYDPRLAVPALRHRHNAEPVSVNTCGSTRFGGQARNRGKFGHLRSRVIGGLLFRPRRAVPGFSHWSIRGSGSRRSHRGASRRA